MANEIKAVLNDQDPSLVGSASIVARLVGDDGEQVGADIPLSESSTLPALYVGDTPDPLARGIYIVAIYDTAPTTDVRVGVGQLFWTGEREITDLYLQEVRNAALAAN